MGVRLAVNREIQNTRVLSRLPDSEDSGSADRALAASGWSAVLERDLLRVFDLAMVTTLETIGLHRTPPRYIERREARILYRVMVLALGENIPDRYITKTPPRRSASGKFTPASHQVGTTRQIATAIIRAKPVLDNPQTRSPYISTLPTSKIRDFRPIARHSNRSWLDLHESPYHLQSGLHMDGPEARGGPG